MRANHFSSPVLNWCQFGLKHLQSFGSLLRGAGHPDDAVRISLVQRVAQRVVGTANVFSGMRTLAAEDMSVFLNEVPGCYFFVGAANADRGLNTPHHSPTFDFDELALDIGVQLLSSVARNTKKLRSYSPIS